MISSLTNQGKLRFMIYQGALNTTIFLNFLHRLIREAARKLFVIVDNLAVHRAHRVTAGVQNNADRIELVYLPPPACAGAGLYGVGSVKRDFSIRGELAVVHANARYTLVFGRSDRPRP